MNILEMSEKSWIGGIYLKEEGGYEIILACLNHYKKRLQTIGSSPELKEAAAMFAPLLQSTARKKIPIIDEVKGKIHQRFTGFNFNSITRTGFRSVTEGIRVS